MKIGECIKKYRESANLTQQQLADKINVSSRTIQNYESNSREPSYDMLEKIANALGYDLEIKFKKRK